MPKSSTEQHPTEKSKTMKQKKLQDAIKGMQVKNWEIREDSNGRRVVYVRFVPKEKSLMVEVEEV
jgi:endonuclease YncB( thermonuclease family)